LESRTLRRPLVVVSVAWWTLSFSWYGLSVWMPTILDKTHGSMGEYAFTFAITAAMLPANVLASYIIDRTGRTRMLAASMAGAAASILVFAFSFDVAGAWLTVISAVVFNGFGTFGWSALDCLTAETFPTDLRNTAVGVAAGVGRLGSLAGQLLIGAHRRDPARSPAQL
jgi:putative MFS transporter